MAITLVPARGFRVFATRSPGMTGCEAPDINAPYISTISERGESVIS